MKIDFSRGDFIPFGFRSMNRKQAYNFDRFDLVKTTERIEREISKQSTIEKANFRRILHTRFPINRKVSFVNKSSIKWNFFLLSSLFLWGQQKKIEELDDE